MNIENIVIVIMKQVQMNKILALNNPQKTKPLNLV